MTDACDAWDVDRLKELDLRGHIDLALQTKNSSWFWFLVGCIAFADEAKEGPWQEEYRAALWKTAAEKDESAGMEYGRDILRAWRKRLK